MLLCLLLQGFSFRIVRPSVYFKTRHSKKNIYVFANLQKNTEIQAINQLNIYVANALRQWYYKAVAKH